MKIFLVVCLFSSVALADGDMTGGGFAPGDMTGGGKAIVKTENSESLDGDMTGGGRAVNDQNQNDSILTFIQKYLISIFE